MKHKILHREASLDDISLIIGIKYVGEKSFINTLNYADFNSKKRSVLVYCNSKKYLSVALKKNNIKAIITTKQLFGCIDKSERIKQAIFLSEDPKNTFFKLHNYLAKNTLFYDDYNFKKIIGNNCKIHKSVTIDDGVIIGNNVTIDENVVVRKGSYIEDNVTIRMNSSIGVNNLELFEDAQEKLVLVCHVGGTKICKNAYIGSNTVIAKNIFEDYCQIGSHTYIDNMVHVSHNSNIGEKNIITSGVIIAGSVIIGDDCWIANKVSISNGITIGNRVKINSGSVVVNNIESNKTVGGFYAVDNIKWLAHIAKIIK